MIKKIVYSIVFLSLFLFQFHSLNAACNYLPWSDVTALVEWCMNDTSVVAVDWDGDISWGFKDKINNWTNNIALFLGLLSVGSIVYWGLMMTLSVWEDEKIKKAKDIVKWSLVWFLWVVLATTIVTLVINIIYWFSDADVKTTAQTEISIIV